MTEIIKVLYLCKTYTHVKSLLTSFNINNNNNNSSSNYNNNNNSNINVISANKKTLLRKNLCLDFLTKLFSVIISFTRFEIV